MDQEHSLFSYFTCIPSGKEAYFKSSENQLYP